MRALLLLLALAGCSDIPMARSENRIREMAREEAAGMVASQDPRIDANQASEIDDLRDRVAKLERKNRELELQLTLRD